MKSKWQQLIESPKGCLEFNSTQSFALQVFWVLRSPKAAMEMIDKGFQSCGKATMRDTPTTLAYFFRISHDQRLAEKLKNEVQTLDQHPHYQAHFKTIDMGVPQIAVENRLKQAGISTAPLSWGPKEPISGHEAELDFDPIVLECTEIYLDNRSFYEHAASSDWMNSYSEIMQTARSLKPTTYCLGSPSQVIWEGVLQDTLKAIRISDDENEQMKAMKPGLFVKIQNKEKEAQKKFFLEINLVLANDLGKIEKCRTHLGLAQQELEAPFMIILPLSQEEKNIFEVRVMMAFPVSKEINFTNIKLLNTDCEKIRGRVIISGGSGKNQEDAEYFRNSSGFGEDLITFIDEEESAKEKKMAGYCLHPLFSQLVENDKVDYKF